MSVSIKELEMKAARQTIQLADREMGLNNSQVASALGVSQRSLYRYKKLENAPSPDVRERLSMLREITQLLNEIFSENDDQLHWLYNTVPLLRGQRPIDLIQKGELEKVISILAGVHSGAFG